MEIFTTINPNDLSDTQLNAISSWTKKYKVYSVNRKEEIERIKDIYKDVNFIETDDTYLYKNKKLIKLNSILDSIEKVSNGISAIINSDIILNDEVELNIKNRYLINGIFIGTRYELDNGEKYPFIYGYDIFIFNSKYAPLFKNEKYVIGMPWWDYWIPICALKNRLNVYHIKDEIIYHKTHETNYEYKIWLEFGRHLYNDIIVDTLDSDTILPLSKFYKGEENEPIEVKKFIESKQINISVV
jgi:hypothetical protein